MDDFTAALREFDQTLKSPQKKAPAPKPSSSQGASTPTKPKPKAPPSPKAAGGGSGGATGVLSRIMTGASEGAIAAVGAPVDVVNWGLKKVGLGSDKPVGGSDWIAGAFGKTIGFKRQGDAALGKSTGTAEDVATKTASFLGGSIVPVAGLYGRGAYLLRTPGKGALTSSATGRALNTMAVETAAKPGVAIASEVGSAVGAASAGEAAQELAPDNEMAQAGAELLGGVLGGVGGAVAGGIRRTAPAVGIDAEGRKVLGWGKHADGTDRPIFGENLKEALDEPTSSPKSAAMLREGAEDDVVTLTQQVAKEVDPEAVPVKGQSVEQAFDEVPVGTIGRNELKDLETEVAGFREKVAAGDARAADISWASAAEDASRVGEFRLSNLGDADDTANLLGALARQLPSKGTRSDEELMTFAKAAADDIGEDPDAVYALGKQIAGQLGDADAAMATLRTVWSRSSKQINELYLGKVNWDEAADELVAHAGESIRNLSILSQMVQQAKVGLGRGLRVLSLDDADSYVSSLKAAAANPEDVIPTARREMPPLPRTREELKDWMDLWGMTDGDPSKQAAMLQGLLTVPPPGQYLRQSVANFFTASILSAPRTLLLNVVGPGVISGIRNVERFTGASMNSIAPWLSAAERGQARQVARYTAKAYMQTFGDIQQVFKQALRAADINHTIIGGGGQNLDTRTTYGPLTENMLAFAGQQPNKAYSLGNAINFFPKAFARLNNGLDEFAKRLAYQGEVRIDAFVEGAEQGLKGADLQRYVDQKLAMGYDEVGHATDQALLRSAERTTLTSSVGEDGSRLRKFSNAIQALRSDIPETRFIIPVFNVPMNALGETLRRLPIAAIPGVNRYVFSETAAELAGERGAVAQADAYGRMMLGASFLMAGYMMNRQGMLTGAGPQDPTDRKVWLQTHQPYSIKLGDKWVSYNKLDIMGGLLAIPATTADLTTYHPGDETVEDLLFGAMGSLSQWFKDRAALQQASELLNFGGDPTKDPAKMFSRVAGSTVSGFFPAALRTTLTDTTSPYVAMKRGWDDYLKASVPYFANQLEPLRNVLGEPISKAADSLGEAFIPVSLQKAVSYENDPVLDELDRLYQVTGYGAGADSRSLSYGYFAPQDVQLEDGKSMYWHFMQARQTMTLEGKTLRQSLKELFNSQAYNDGVDGDSGSKQTSRGDPVRGYMVKELFASYNKAIKAEMAEASPKARAYLTAATAKQKDDAYLRDVTVEDLVSNPRLYDVKGVYRQGFEDKLREGSSGALMEAFRRNQ